MPKRNASERPARRARAGAERAGEASAAGRAVVREGKSHGARGRVPDKPTDRAKGAVNPPTKGARGKGARAGATSTPASANPAHGSKVGKTGPKGRNMKSATQGG